MISKTATLPPCLLLSFLFHIPVTTTILKLISQQHIKLLSLSVLGSRLQALRLRDSVQPMHVVYFATTVCVWMSSIPPHCKINTKVSACFICQIIEPVGPRNFCHKFPIVGLQLQQCPRKTGVLIRDTSLLVILYRPTLQLPNAHLPFSDSKERETLHVAPVSSCKLSYFIHVNSYLVI